MKVGIIVNTPAQAHFYKNIVRELRRDGHSVSVLARDYGETSGLLQCYRIDHYSFSPHVESQLEKLVSLPRDLLNVYRYLRGEKVDVIVGGGLYAGLTCLLSCPHIDYGDGEPKRLGTMQLALTKLTMRFVDVMLTPASFGEDLGRKQVRIDSFKELSYLSPACYRPNSDIYDYLGIPASEEYVLLRFCAFDSLHDVGVKGFSVTDRITLVRELEKHATVFISSENGVPDEIKDRVLKAPKCRIHDVIAHARLVVSDTGTINAEAAVLGVPSIRFSSIGGEKDMGVFRELEQKYGLIYTFDDPKKAIGKALELVRRPGLAEEWKVKRMKLLASNIDITKFFVWFIEHYPESFEKMKSSPAAQYSFSAAIPENFAPGV